MASCGPSLGSQAQGEAHQPPMSLGAHSPELTFLKGTHFFGSDRRSLATRASAPPTTATTNTTSDHKPLNQLASHLANQRISEADNQASSVSLGVHWRRWFFLKDTHVAWRTLARVDLSQGHTFFLIRQAVASHKSKRAIHHRHHQQHQRPQATQSASQPSSQPSHQ